jgi:ubiquitin-protein ligase
MASQGAIKRLQKDLLALKKDADPNFDAFPDPKNILHWTFVFDGPAGTPYEGGEYLGRLQFPSNFPFCAPSIVMVTPSGRFETERKICTTMSDFHPETWSPMWTAAKIIQGVISFMVQDDQAHAVGGMASPEPERRQLARFSRNFNLAQPIYAKAFPVRAAKAKELMSAPPPASLSPPVADAIAK